MNKLFAAGLIFSFLAILLPRADAAQFPPEFGGPINLFTNSIPALGNVTNTGPKRPFEVVGGSMATISLTLIGGNIGTSNVVCYFNGTLDGVNWTTTFPHSFTAASNGTNHWRSIVILGTNLPARLLSLDKITTDSTNSIIITNVGRTYLPVP